mmetsp:Transcript_10876/g.27425  ORF Transcript_10876/g.27425 Transcript_10876/m.27425 type:complete len:378 (-) Transcript_10876:798-1931(-)
MTTMAVEDPVEDSFKKAGEKALSEQADARVLSKLSKGDADRAAERERRKERAAEAANPEEDVGAFNAAQQATAQSVEQALQDLVAKKQEGDKSFPSTRNEIHEAKDAFERLRLAVLGMERAAANASYFLSAYDVRATSDLAKGLREKIDAVQKQVLPRKAFSFSRRKVMRERNAIENTNASAEGGKKSGRSSDQGAGGEGAGAAAPVVEVKGMKVESKENEVVVLSQANATSDDIEICSCSNTTFYVVVDKLAVLRLVNLTNCKVYCGPVDGSLYLEGARACVVMAAAHQVRIHKAVNVDFYVRSRSYPIIEKCSDVRFAPYGFSYEGLEARLQEAKLGEENDLWADVKDFGWLKSTPSPNWSILPAEQRKQETMTT